MSAKEMRIVIDTACAGQIELSTPTPNPPAWRTEYSGNRPGLPELPAQPFFGRRPARADDHRAVSSAGT